MVDVNHGFTSSRGRSLTCHAERPDDNLRRMSLEFSTEALLIDEGCDDMMNLILEYLKIT